MTPDTLPTVRIASPEDLAALTGLALAFRDHLGQSTPSAEQLRASLARLLADPSTQFILAEGAGLALGYAQCRYRYSLWTGAPDLELEDLFVAAAARRCGVGRRVVELALADRARTRVPTRLPGDQRAQPACASAVRTPRLQSGAQPLAGRASVVAGTPARGSVSGAAAGAATSS